MLSTTLARASVWSRLKSVPSEHPFAFGVFVSGVKTSFSDLLVQKVVERKEQVDWKRNFAFATFGFIYLGGVQYAIYVPLFGRLFPKTASFVAKPFREKLKDTKGILGTMAQVFLDQAVHHPFMYFPAFYATVRNRVVLECDLMPWKMSLNENVPSWVLSERARDERRARSETCHAGISTKHERGFVGIVEGLGSSHLCQFLLCTNAPANCWCCGNVLVLDLHS